MADLVQPLDERQIARFKRDGFLQLRNVLDPQLCARAREVLWEHNEIHRLRHDPFGPFLYAEQDFPAAGDRAAASGPPPGGTRRGYRWHLSVVGSDPLFVDLVGGAAYPYAQQLLGAAQTSTPRASGGIHCTLPAAKGVGRFARRRGYSAHPMECHVDQTLDSRERLGVVGYIDAVPPGSGAFSVWAGSHLRVNSLLREGAAARARPLRNDLKGVMAGSYGPRMTAELQSIIADTPLTDCWGAAGDIVLFHARIAHTPSHNFGNTIRQAVITGFGKTVESLPDSELTAHVDEHNLWRDWSSQVRECSDSIGTPPALHFSQGGIASSGAAPVPRL